MEWAVLPVYAICALVNFSNKPALTVAASFWAIEYAHSLLNFEYAAAHYFSIALMTLLPAYASRFLDVTKQRKIIASCLGLVCVYFAAWVCSELGLPESPFKWPHIAILIYQFGVLNGDNMDAGRRILADAYQYCIGLHLRYHAGN